jgi:multiple sugar transport system permease protein/raffinose/stachyose/melibiose transport system permease protein
VALLVIFQIYPLIDGAWLSLHTWDGLSPARTFVGLANFRSVLSDAIFWTSMRNAFLFGCVGVVVGGSLGLALALLVNSRRHLSTTFRAIFFLPWMLSTVVFGYLWLWILDPNIGPFNRALGAITGHTISTTWLGDPKTAFWTVAAVFVWAHWGFGFLVFLSALQNIPRDLMEAAALDGAGPIARFRYIVRPLLMPIVILVSVVSLLLALQIFGTVLIMTNGGPGYSTQVPTVLIYQEAFQYFRVGRSAAMSVIFGAFMVAVSILQARIGRRWGHD